MRAEFNRKLILEDGQEYYGYAFGDTGDKVCEIVFNTSMAGYQEILSDLSYAGQAVVMTYPLIGNYGMAQEDEESDLPAIGALIVREYNNEPSNFRSCATLSEVMEKFKIPGIYGVDTRKLTRSIRDYGSRKVLMTGAGTSLKDGLAVLGGSPSGIHLVSSVSCKQIWTSGAGDCCIEGKHAEKGSMEECHIEGKYAEKGSMEGCRMKENHAEKGNMKDCRMKGSYIEEKYHVVLIDCGVKKNIIRCLNQHGCRVTIIPWDSPAELVEHLQPDGVLVSNGPGDPEDVPQTVATVKALLGRYPVFGICLGHQIISLAYGAKTYKLKFGHHGGNHPVKELATGRIEITSQNHSFAVDERSLAGTPLTVTHRNLLDGTVEGIKCEKDNVFSVQYHPESAPGPRDSISLFGRFIEQMEVGRHHA